MLEDDDYISHSVPSFDFKFFASREMEDNTDFTVIKEDAAVHVLKFHKTFKSQIIKAMKVEITLLKQRTKKKFFTLLPPLPKQRGCPPEQISPASTEFLIPLWSSTMNNYSMKLV